MSRPYDKAVYMISPHTHNLGREYLDWLFIVYVVENVCSISLGVLDNLLIYRGLWISERHFQQYTMVVNIIEESGGKLPQVNNKYGHKYTSSTSHYL